MTLNTPNLEMDEASVIKRLNLLSLSGPANGNCCSCCGVGPFESRQQQTAHYKNHWHTHNLKRKLFGKLPLTLRQFTSRQGGAAVIHKTHHSYVTRRGQGQAQASRDQHGNAPKSAGASLRRYNQAQFIEHVQDIISSWAEDLAGCSIILYRAVGPINQGALFGKTSPLSKDDPRIRVLPFPTRKPTYKEIQRVHETVASVEVYDTMELFQKALIASTTRPPAKTNSDTSIERGKKTQKSPCKPIDRAKSRERPPRDLPTQMLSSEDEGPCYIDSETPVGWIKTLSEQTSKGIITNSRKDLIHDVIVARPVSSDSEGEKVQEKKEVKKKKKKKEDNKEEKKGGIEKKQPPKIASNVKKMWKLISGEENSLETILETWEGSLEEACNIKDPVDGNTALHKAAIASKPEMNNQLQTPYAAAPQQDTRIAFRLFQALHPDKYNYSKVKANELRCFLCGNQLPKDAFQYDSYKFCTIRCLQNHRNIRPLQMSV
ncbi:hypothetical protein MSG28_010421 [Choristoneura fumiferana]|uniref:Uncharacterized protein n=1 Tax=Choristoneura fumiferana TaxID=7141 RepID=A0ACC0KL00_CHOFU|nr:hypothetical protein MSG28_010421 [Choristoneura fumiferana]